MVLVGASITVPDARVGTSALGFTCLGGTLKFLGPLSIYIVLIMLICLVIGLLQRPDILMVSVSHLM